MPACARRRYSGGRRPAIELKQLRYFVRIVELGSLSRAAGAVHIGQSALSQHVAALEDEFHTALLARSARGVMPTGVVGFGLPLSLGIAFDDGNFEGLAASPPLEERLFLVVGPEGAA